MFCSILSLQAQTFVKPTVKVKDTSFAVITDKGIRLVRLNLKPIKKF